MSRTSITAVISRVKKQYTPAVLGTEIVAIVGPGQPIHDAEAERRPGICPGIVLPTEVRTQKWGLPRDYGRMNGRRYYVAREGE